MTLCVILFYYMYILQCMSILVVAIIIIIKKAILRKMRWFVVNLPPLVDKWTVWITGVKKTGSPLFTVVRGRPFNSWGWGWVISGHQEFFFLAIWWAGYFFPFFSHKLSITFVLHAIFFFRQALAGNFFSKSPTPPPQEWSAPLSIALLLEYFSCHLFISVIPFLSF